MKVYKVMFRDHGSARWETDPGRFTAADHGTNDGAYDAACDRAASLRTMGYQAVVARDPDQE